MSSNYGRKLSAVDSIVGYWDSKNPKSYLGEPTENLVPYFEPKQRTWRRNSDGSSWINFINDYEVEYDFLISEQSDGDALLFYPSLSASSGKVEEGWYTWSVEVMELGHWNLSSGQRMNIAIQDGGANQVASLNIANPVLGEKYSVSYYNPPENTSFARLQIYISPSLKTGDSAKIRLRYQLEKKPYPTPFTETERPYEGALKDLIGNKHLYLNNVSFNEDGLYFDGIDDYINIGSDENFHLPEVTWEVWLKPEEHNSSTIISNSPPRYGIFLDASGQFVARITTEGNQQNTTARYMINEFDRWYHVTGTASLSQGFVRLYVDGELFSETIFTQNQNLEIIPEAIAIGRGLGYFKGKMDNIKVFSKPLSPEEIKNNYNALKGRYNL